MTWTDDRLELLKKLWADGLSASQIAAELGGVTRNAVIGKVHRLGLSGRAKSPSSAVPRVRKARPASMRPRISITELSEATCRWPIGDPGAEDFAYCGSQTKAALPYCPYHSRIAYQ